MEKLNKNIAIWTIKKCALNAEYFILLNMSKLNYLNERRNEVVAGLAGAPL